MSRRLRLAVASTAALIALGAATVALAASTQTYSQSFTTKHPGQRTGTSFRASGSKEAKLVKLTFPAGTLINPGALAKCTKPSACPAASKVGAGTATVTVAGTALPPLAVKAYNRAGGMVLVIANPVGAPVVLKPALAGRTLTIPIPQIKANGIPVMLSSLKLNVGKLGSAKKPYLRTPAHCPKGGAFVFTARFTYTDGTSTTLTSRSACTKH